MIDIPTVLILGAGSSYPYDYPIGSGLKNKIIDELGRLQNSDSGWVTDLKFEEDLIKDFLNHFIPSPKSSIDSFLAYHKEEFVHLGKISIVSAISQCEVLGNLFSHNQKKDDWHTYLFNNIMNCPFDAINENKITFITYNYDRSLETALFYALKYSYKEAEDVDACKSILKNIPIIHMYGRLDPLTWESENGREYGEPISSENLFEMSENIKLIQEAAKEKIPSDANKLIKEAQRVYFLGLDLRRTENLELLDLSNLEGKEIIGTAVNLEQSEKRQIKKFMDNYSKNDRGSTQKPRAIIDSLNTLSMIRRYKAFE
jgi:hypothetical protein